MNKATLLVISSLVVLIRTPGSVFAGVLDVTAVACPNALHVADFNVCAKDAAQGALRTGLYVATNPTSPLSSLVRVTGTISGCDRKTNCRLIGVKTIPVKLNGDLVTSDDDLVIIDQGLFAQLRTPSQVTRPIHIPERFGTSYINNPALEEDTSTAISRVLYIDRNISPNNVPKGTVVVVIWSDKTTAEFVKIDPLGEIQWAMVPGSARRSLNGEPINRDGTPVANPHGGGGGDGGGSVTPTTDPTYWVIHDGGESECSGRVSITDGADIIDMLFFFPC